MATRPAVGSFPSELVKANDGFLRHFSILLRLLTLVGEEMTATQARLLMTTPQAN